MGAHIEHKGNYANTQYRYVTGSYRDHLAFK